MKAVLHCSIMMIEWMFGGYLVKNIWRGHWTKSSRECWHSTCLGAFFGDRLGLCTIVKGNVNSDVYTNNILTSISYHSGWNLNPNIPICYFCRIMLRLTPEKSALLKVPSKYCPGHLIQLIWILLRTSRTI